MPSFAEMIYGTAQNAATQSSSGLAEGFKQGIELAVSKEKNQRAIEENRMKQQELNDAKQKNFFEYLKEVKNYQNAADRNRFLKSGIGYRNALQLKPTESLSDDDIMAMGSDENMGRMSTLDAAIASGQLTHGEANAIARDRKRFGQIVPTPAEAIQFNKTDWSDSQKEFLDRQSRDRQADLAAKKAGGTQDRFDTKMLVDLSNKFDSKVAKQKDKLTAADNILTLLDSKQPMSDSAVRTQLARLSGEVGALSDFDVKAWSGDQALLERAKQYMSLASEGKLTDANRTQMKQVAQTMKQIVQNRIKIEADRTIKLGKNAGVDEETIRDSLGLEELLTSQGPSGAKVKLSAGEFPEAQIIELGKRNPKNKYYLEYLEQKKAGK